MRKLVYNLHSTTGEFIQRKLRWKCESNMFPPVPVKDFLWASKSSSHKNEQSSGKSLIRNFIHRCCWTWLSSWSYSDPYRLLRWGFGCSAKVCKAGVMCVYWGEWVKWVGHFLTRLQTFVFISRTPVWPFPWSMDHGTLFFFFNNMSFHHLKLKLVNHVQENTAIRHTLQTNCQGRLITISW